VSTSEAARLREREQEVRELRRANEILKRAARFLSKKHTGKLVLLPPRPEPQP
jgi:hypothetical protein